MRLKSLALIALLFALSACSSSHRVTYSGHEESTEGVPGFVNGKRVAPNVKLGQSYSIDGETYVPRYQPDYVEKGLASWYGPGFHGGKTANGETFDKHEMTAAHRTLPLPSIVRVTLESTGKSAIVRVNDRGPFAKGRIIDLSRGAAEKIGLIGVGVGKVRVEYLPAESQRFADLLADGRDPKSIDVNDEVLAYTQNHSTPAPASVPANPFALADASQNAPAPAKESSSWFDQLFVSEAQAATPPVPTQPLPTREAIDNFASRDNTVSNVDAGNISSNDLPPSALPMGSGAQPVIQASPDTRAPPLANQGLTPAGVSAPIVLPKATSPPMAVASITPKSPAGALAPSFIQIGAFANKANAELLVAKVRDLGPASISAGQIANGQTIYRVRMGPYRSPEVQAITVNRLSERNIVAQSVRDP
ncbi:MAG: septal ring lytic transglycosylase RlpA family protein [Rickettsiales bacterium]